MHASFTLTHTLTVALTPSTLTVALSAALYPRSVAGNYTEALDVAEQQMRLLKESYGVGHHEYATAMNNVATLYQAVGRYNEAEPLLLEASKIQQRTLGDDHPHTVASLSNLATVYQAMGNTDAAAVKMIIDGNAKGVKVADANGALPLHRAAEKAAPAAVVEALRGAYKEAAEKHRKRAVNLAKLGKPPPPPPVPPTTKAHDASEGAPPHLLDDCLPRHTDVWQPRDAVACHSLHRRHADAAHHTGDHEGTHLPRRASARQRPLLLRKCVRR